MLRQSMRWDERNDASKKRRVTATRERVRHTTHREGSTHREVEADKTGKVACDPALACLVHPTQEGGRGWGWGCSQPGSGRPDLATAAALTHATPPANGQTPARARPAHQPGSQMRSTATGPFCDFISSSLRKKNRQQEPEEPNLISASEARIGPACARGCRMRRQAVALCEGPGYGAALGLL